MENENTKEARWIFSALEVGQSVALGGDVRLALDPRTTVLVGKNGAGKSALLEAIRKAAAGATGVVTEIPPDPSRFIAEVNQDNDSFKRLRYECRWRAREKIDNRRDDLDERTTDDFADIEEVCSSHDEQIWSLKDGLLQRIDGKTEMLPPGRGLLNGWIRIKRPKTLPTIAEPLFELLNVGVSYVRAGVPRAEMERDVAIIPYGIVSKQGARFEKRYEHVARGIWHLMMRLADWQEVLPEILEEFVTVGRRLGLLQDIKIEHFPNPEHAADKRAPPMLLGVSVDGTNLGLLSDGTLRVLQILVDLIDPETKLLLLEEPEIAVHPGLLGRLLEEIDVYSTDRQILLSTQSPQVVSWAKPDSLRLVERTLGVTHVRSLNEEERARVGQYLEDQGTLGDYLYAGALDG